MLKLFYIPVVSLVFLGCNSNPTEMLVDYKFKTEESLVIQQAVDEWHNVTGSDDAMIQLDWGFKFDDDVFEQEDFTTVDDKSTLQRMSMEDPGYISLLNGVPDGKVVYGAGALYTSVVINWEPFWKDGEFDSDFLHVVLLHEFGHYFGLGHEGSGIMTPAVLRNYSPCIDQITLNSYCNVHDDCVDPKSDCE